MLDGDPSPPKRVDSSPYFLAHVLWPNGYMDQDAIWYEVGRDPGNIVLDGDQPPLPKGHIPQFSAYVCCGQMAGLIRMPLGTEIGLGPGDIALDGDPAPPKKGTSPTFRPMSIVAKWSPISATAELSTCLFFCFLHYSFCFFLVPCGSLSWLPISLWAHVNVVHRCLYHYH